jgi:hypothetical protein
MKVFIRSFLFHLTCGLIGLAGGWLMIDILYKLILS